jgi:hypothetical protein
MTIKAHRVHDRLYGISFRPQELAVYGEKVAFSLRYGPVTDDEPKVATQHFKLLVLEIHAQVKPSDDLAPAAPRRLQLLKCGWELELRSEQPVLTAQLPEESEEIRQLLEKIADTVNDLARRAQLEAPLGPEVVDDLVQQYRTSLAQQQTRG